MCSSDLWSDPVYGGMFWLNRTGSWPVPEDAYYMAGAGGQYTLIIPTHDLVVVRLGHYKGGAAGHRALHPALALLMEAVPQRRATWQPPPPTPCCGSPSRNSVAPTKPASRVRGPMRSLNERTSPGARLAPSSRVAASRMLCARPRFARSVSNLVACSIHVRGGISCPPPHRRED